MAKRDETVFPPVRHRGIIGALYKNLGVEKTLETSPRLGDPALPGDCRVSVQVDARINAAYIEIEQYGESIVQEVGRRLKEICLAGIDVVFLRLNLHDPLTARMTPEFEELGFFFCGMIPHAHSRGDALILQYLNNTAVDYDAIEIDSAMGRDLLQYIRQADPNVAVRPD